MKICIYGDDQILRETTVHTETLEIGLINKGWVPLIDINPMMKLWEARGPAIVRQLPDGSVERTWDVIPIPVEEIRTKVLARLRDEADGVMRQVLGTSVIRQHVYSRQSTMAVAAKGGDVEAQAQIGRLGSPRGLTWEKQADLVLSKAAAADALLVTMKADIDETLARIRTAGSAPEIIETETAFYDRLRALKPA